MKYRSEPVEKTLTLLEAFQGGPNRGLTHRELMEATGLSAATLLRMLRTLESRGYVTRDGQKAYRPAFRLERGLPVEGDGGRRLHELLETLSADTGVTAELLTIRPPDLSWYDQVQPPRADVVVRATIGTRRTLRELDAPSRIVLAHWGAEKTRSILGEKGYVHVTPPGKPMTWKDVTALLSATPKGAIAWDPLGNANGVRRHALALTDKGGDLLAVVSLAEAALARTDDRAHVAGLHGALKAFAAGFKTISLRSTPD